MSWKASSQVLRRVSFTAAEPPDSAARLNDVAAGDARAYFQSAAPQPGMLNGAFLVLGANPVGGPVGVVDGTVADLDRVSAAGDLDDRRGLAGPRVPEMLGEALGVDRW